MIRFNPATSAAKTARPAVSSPPSDRRYRTPPCTNRRRGRAGREPTNAQRGIVRLTGRELADRNRSKLSRGELTPFSERGRAVLLEDIAAIEVTVVVEMIVDRGVDGGELLQGLDVPEVRHRPLSSSKRLV